MVLALLAPLSFLCWVAFAFLQGQREDRAERAVQHDQFLAAIQDGFQTLLDESLSQRQIQAKAADLYYDSTILQGTMLQTRMDELAQESARQQEIFQALQTRVEATTTRKTLKI